MDNVIPVNMPSIGGGMAQGAGEVMTLLPQYKMALADAMSQGQDFPDFRTWLMQQQSAQAAPKILPR